MDNNKQNQLSIKIEDDTMLISNKHKFMVHSNFGIRNLFNCALQWDNFFIDMKDTFEGSINNMIKEASAQDIKSCKVLKLERPPLETKNEFQILRRPQHPRPIDYTVSLYEKEFSEDINLIIYDEDNLLVNINDIEFTDKEEYSKAISQLLIDMEKECFSLCADFCNSEAFKKEYILK